MDFLHNKYDVSPLYLLSRKRYSCVTSQAGGIGFNVRPAREYLFCRRASQAILATNKQCTFQSISSLKSARKWRDALTRPFDLDE